MEVTSIQPVGISISHVLVTACGSQVTVIYHITLSHAGVIGIV
jgi:hypothetical protein